MSYLNVLAINSFCLNGLSDDQVINSKERNDCARSSWVERWQKLDGFNQAFYEHVKEIFKNKMNLTGRHFDKAWEQALTTHQITWNKGDPLTGKTLKAIDRALSDNLKYAGKGIQWDWKSSGNAQTHAAVRYLLGRGDLPVSALSMRNVKAVFMKQDEQVLQELQCELRGALEACAEHLPAANSKEEPLFQAFVGNIVALLPYSYPKIGDTFTIPQKIDNCWKQCKYTVDRRIDMSPNWLCSPMAAYGLSSLEKKAPPILSFLGTTYPTGDGFLATLLSDFTPGLSVGHAAYLYGKSQIEQWIGQQAKKVRLYGASLGGALCMHVVRNHRERIAGIEAYNPPFLYPWSWDKPFEKETPINIYYQENDLVSTMGVCPSGEGVSIYRVFGAKEENFLKAHVRVYSGSEEVLIVKSSPEYENSRFSRKILTGLHILGGLLIGLIPAVCLGLLYINYASLKSFFSEENSEQRSLLPPMLPGL